MDSAASYVLVGGGGFVGSALTRHLVADGKHVVVVDRRGPTNAVADGVSWICADLLEDDVELPAGRVVLLAGCSDPRPRRPWTLFLDNAVVTARLLPQLHGRDVTLLSSIEVYGTAKAPLTEATQHSLPRPDAEISEWCTRAISAAAATCPPWRIASLCRELVGAGVDGRWDYAVAKRAQELMLLGAVPIDRLTVLRTANVFGAGQERVVSRLIRRALSGQPLVVTDSVRSFISVDRLATAIANVTRPGLHNVSDGSMHLFSIARTVSDELGTRSPIQLVTAPDADSCGIVAGRPVSTFIGRQDLHVSIRQFAREVADSDLPLFDPPVPVVVPPRPERPDVVADRQQRALWSGAVKHGNRWTNLLTDRLSDALSVEADHELLLTTSGTTALTLAVLTVAGRARPGDVAVLPSFTFAATGEVLEQLGYALRFCDVDVATWTLDPAAVHRALAPGDVRVVVAVDALGNPADYRRLRAVCADAGVPLVGDSAPSVGARYDGIPVGTQADAHAFSFSFAKVVSAGGAGGALVLRREHRPRLDSRVNWLRSALLGELPAIAALDLVEHLDELVARRESVASVYGELVSRRGGLLNAQGVRPGDRHALVHYVVRIAEGRRAAVATRLAHLGVQTKPYYEPALHTHYGSSVELPVTEALVADTLALPMSSELTVSDAERVVMAVDLALDSPASALRRTTASRDLPARAAAPAHALGATPGHSRLSTAG